MPRVKVLKGRNATTVVEANGEILFVPGGLVPRWTNRLSNAITRATRNAAPSNKRPRWAHYGAPLKTTFTSNTRANTAAMRVYSAVGSRAPHALYVDQGTGVYNGSGPYRAKVIPPWTVGGASLYEHTWRPGGPGERRVAPVMIRGQRGQYFFDEGLRNGFAAMRIVSFEVPGTAQISSVLNTMPSGLLSGPGNTPNNGAFRASLAEWRQWRDDAWNNGEGLGRGGGIGSKAQEKFREKARASKGKPDRTRKDTSVGKPKRPATNKKARAADRAKFIQAMVKKYGKVDPGSVRYENGYWYMTVWGEDSSGRKTWIERRAKAKT